ncbi:MAG: dipeptidyl-peptidase-4, partial [Flavobacteriaceae bacterium]
MKKTFILFFFTSLVFGQLPTISLENLWNGDYNPKRLEAIRSMKNGTNYTVLETSSENGNSTIMQYDFNKIADGTVVIASENHSQISSFSDYSFSKNEEKIVLETDVNPIYRRSKQGIYWVYDLKNKKVQKISNNKIQEPLFSP